MLQYVQKKVLKISAPKCQNIKMIRYDNDNDFSLFHSLSGLHCLADKKDPNKNGFRHRTRHMHMTEREPPVD